MRLKNNLLALAFVALNLLSFQAFATYIYSYNFDRITNAANENIGNQLLLEVSSDPLSNSIAFKFLNNIGIKSSITDIYFDMGNTSLFSKISMYSDSGSGVEFDNSANPANLPAGNTISFSSDFSGDSPTPAKGVDKLGEWVTFLGVLSAGKSLNALLDALKSGNFMVGLHVQSIGSNGQSDSYVNKVEVSAVPLPAAAWLFGSALMGFVVVSNRRRV